MNMLHIWLLEIEIECLNSFTMTIQVNALVPPRVPENLNFADGICQTRTRKKG